MKIVEENFIKIYEKSFIENWDLPALSEYTTRQSLTYAELAQSVALLEADALEEHVAEGSRWPPWPCSLAWVWCSCPWFSIR